jgi:GAF domain-containing protein
MTPPYEIDLAREHAELTRRYVAAEQQKMRLANLYVSMQRLHSSLERAHIIEAIAEIVINLIGSEEYAIFEFDAKRETVDIVSCFGVDPCLLEWVKPGDGLIGRCLSKGTLFVRNGSPSNVNHEIETRLSACIPLRAADRIWGAVAVFSLLPQKDSLGVEDVELFDLLSAHGGLALYCSTLHEQIAEGRR